MLNRVFLSASILALSIGPALAGDGGDLDAVGGFVIQVLGRLAGKLIGIASGNF